MNKQYSTIGCCGIDCGLCPRFYTQGSSACPGCGGKDFAEKHPSCGYLTCCSVKRNLEVCAQCNEFHANGSIQKEKGTIHLLPPNGFCEPTLNKHKGLTFY